MFDHYLQKLREALKKESLMRAEVVELGGSFLWQEHELLTALYALLCQKVSLPRPPLYYTQLPGGSVPLFSRGGFPWGALPYPKEHAELAALYGQLGESETAEKMAAWQKKMTLDHAGKPLVGLFSQGREVLEEAPSTDIYRGIFTDPELGIVGQRTENSTCIVLGTGCKSGMGSFLVEDVGIVTFGPQQDGSFGIAGRPLFFHHEEKEGFEAHFQTRLAASHPRNTGFLALQDSGYSGLWIDVTAHYADNRLHVSCLFEGFTFSEKTTFALFGRGKECLVQGTHKLQPQSQDRYGGPPQRVALQGHQGKVFVEALTGASKMEIIPLNEAGADFLILFSGLASKLEFSIND